MLLYVNCERQQTGRAVCKRNSLCNWLCVLQWRRTWLYFVLLIADKNADDCTCYSRRIIPLNWPVEWVLHTAWEHAELHSLQPDAHL